MSTILTPSPQRDQADNLAHQERFTERFELSRDERPEAIALMLNWFREDCGVYDVGDRRRALSGSDLRLRLQATAW